LGKVEKDSTKRKSIRLFLFGKEKGLTPAEYHAIIEWIGATPENGYTPSPHVAQEIQAVLNEYRKEKGQQEMALTEEPPQPGDVPQTMAELYEWADYAGFSRELTEATLCRGSQCGTVKEALDFGWTAPKLWQFIAEYQPLTEDEPQPEEEEPIPF